MATILDDRTVQAISEAQNRCFKEGVDDWKVSSVFVGAIARRSISSLGNMEVGAPLPPNRRRLHMIGAAVVPLTVFTLYLVASRWPTRWFSSTSDYLGLAVAEACGVICIWRVIAHPGWRLIASLIYLLLCSGILILFGFGFVCGAFGDCL